MTLYKGTDFKRRIVVTEADGETRTNLDGTVLSIEVRRRTGAPVLIELSSGAGITHLDQSGETRGEADLVISAAQSAALEAPSLHVITGKLDGEVIIKPQHIEVMEL